MIVKIIELDHLDKFRVNWS